MSYIGVDLHTNPFMICRLDADGLGNFAAYQLSKADVGRFCLGLDVGDELVLESTGNAVWFCDAVRPCVSRIVVVNPGQFQMIRQSVKKTDHNDARAFAFFLSKGIRPETRLKSMTKAGLASLVRTRDSFVKSSTLLLNRIHTLYNRRGMKPKKEGLASRKKLLALDSSQYHILKSRWVFSEFTQFKIKQSQLYNGQLS